jgi:hypothetical protein
MRLAGFLFIDRNSQILADLLRQEVVNLTMAGNGGRPIGFGIEVDRMPSAFSNHHASMSDQVGQKIFSFHPVLRY